MLLARLNWSVTAKASRSERAYRLPTPTKVGFRGRLRRPSQGRAALSCKRNIRRL